MQPPPSLQLTSDLHLRLKGLKTLLLNQGASFHNSKEEKTVREYFGLAAVLRHSHGVIRLPLPTVSVSATWSRPPTFTCQHTSLQILLQALWCHPPGGGNGS